MRVRILSADISTVICDKADKAQVLLDNVERRDTPGLRRIILMDACEPALVEHGKRCGVHVQALQEVEVCEIPILALHLHLHLNIPHMCREIPAYMACTGLYSAI